MGKRGIMDSVEQADPVPRRWPMFRALSSVRGRIIGGFGLLVVILIVVGAGSAWQVRTHQSDLAAMEEHTATASLLQDAHLRSEAAAAGFQRYITVGDEPQITGDEVLLPEIRSNVAVALESLTQALAQAQTRGDGEQIARLNAISAEAGSLALGVEQAIALRQTGGVQAQATALEAMVLPFRQYEDDLDEAAGAEFQKASDLRSRADRAGDLAFWLLVISGTLGAALGLAASVLIARSIIRPLSSLEATAVAASGGDLSARAPATGPRELAHLGSALNDMMGAVELRTQELRLANEEMRARNRQLIDARAQAATDPLTGLGNHRVFQKRIRDEIAAADANGTSVGLIMFDIDRFKSVNDSLGHQAGDEILRRLATVLPGVVGEGEAYRYGGDEFAVLLTNVDLKKATKTAEELRLAVAKMTAGNGEKITISLGVGSFPEMAAAAEELIYRADMAMYWAKSTGKNRVGDWDGLLSRRSDGVVPRDLGDRGSQAQDAVVALVSSLGAKDPTTRDHIERCSWYTAELAEELGLGEAETSIVRLAALLHDVGKLVIPTEVLRKPGLLSEDEWLQMRTHPTSAFHILSSIDSIAGAAPAVLHHHEHYDGSGYPDGLAGDDIPIASRILLVTDAFDAMTTDRPYRKAMRIEAAVEELQRNSGSQFDPAVVEAFLRMVSRSGAHPLRSAAAGEETAGARAPRESLAE